MSTEDNLIEVNNLSFNREDRVIFDNIKIDVPRGKITGIMGPSGTGKTTLLRLISAQLQPSAGDVIIDGINIANLKREKLFHLRSKMGFLFQSGALFTDISVFDNVAFPLRVHTKLCPKMIRDIVLMKLQAVGLSGAIDLMPSELSGGMTRRVALARAIALDPMLVMYDEPFVGQDPIAKGVLVQLIRQLNDALGLTSLLVSHDIDETMGICDYVYIISGSHVLAQGSPEKLMINADNSPEICQFLKGLPDGPVPFHYGGDHYLQDLLQGAL